MRYRHVTHLSDSLSRHLWATLPPPPAKPPKPPTVVHGPKLRSAYSHPGTKQPDDLLLEARRLHETEGLGAKRIAAKLDIPVDRAYQILRYATRAHLVPERRAEPYWTKPEKGDEA